MKQIAGFAGVKSAVLAVLAVLALGIALEAAERAQPDAGGAGGGRPPADAGQLCRRGPAHGKALRGRCVLLLNDYC